MKTAVTFVRVSTFQQDNKRQIKDINEFTKGKFVIKKTFEEKISGATKIEERIVLQEAINYLIENNIKHLIISEFSRLGRTTEVLQIINKLNNHKICLISIKENIYTLNEDFTINANTQLLLTVLTAINNFELETIKYRTNSGRALAVKNRNLNIYPKLPYGYKRGENKDIVIDENESKIVQLVFKKYVEDRDGFTKIANFLNLKNVKTKYNKKWTAQQIKKMISNNIYVGIRKFLGEEYHFSQIQIIDDNTFDKAQNLVMKNGQNVEDFNKLKKYNFLFDGGFCKCEKCGKSLYIATNSKNNRYRCVSGKYSKGCGVKSELVTTFENSIVKYIINNFFNLLINNEEVIDKRKKVNEEIEILKSKIVFNNNSLKRLENLYINLAISETDFYSKRKQLITLNNNLNNQLKKEKVKLQNLNTIEKNVIGLGRYIRDENGNYKFDVEGVNKKDIRSIIKSITMSNEKIKVTMINDAVFTIDRN